MRVIDKRVYTGKNIYSHKLCIRLTVDVEELFDTPTKDIVGFNEKLLSALPGLKKHHCSLGYEGGFSDRLDEGTYLPHVFEHMIIEMQNNLGYQDVKYGKARCVDKSIYHVVFQYDFDEAALLCADTALACVNSFIAGKNYDMKASMENIEKKISQRRVGPSTMGILNEARKRNIPVMRIGNDSIFQLGYGCCQRRIEATLTNKTSCIGVDISCDKELTREVLKCANLPITTGKVAENVIEIINTCEKIGYPLVIKPINGCKGKGVTVDIRNEKEAMDAYSEATRSNTKVLVEKYIEGNDYRILVVDDKVVGVTMRIPPWVTGDGINTIMDLIEIENENPLRGYDHEKPLTKIVVDDIMINYLKRKNLSLAYIPRSGEEVTLRFNANLSTGGVAKDCTDIIHPDNIEIAIQAARVVGLDIAGIDVCTKDISKSMRETGGVILEVNAAPGIRMHMYPNFGKSRNVATEILDYLYKNGEKSIPVVTITGTNGKTTVTRMIAHILSCKGLNIGMTTTSGVYINDRIILKGDTTGPESARMILMDKRVEAAVLETARGGILRRGLGYDLADVGVITNVSEDHLGLDGINSIEELVSVKSLVAEAIKEDGYAVLNADDASVNAISERVTSRIIYFSKNHENLIIRKQILDGGICVFVKDNYICYSDKGKVMPIIAVNEIPSTMDGILMHNVENAMAAVGAAIGLKIDTEAIIKGLRTFLLDDDQNPGRFNVYNLDKFKVVVDYGHNTESYKAVIRSVKKMECNRTVGVIGVPGDRNDGSIISAGKIAGEGFDSIIIKEDVDRRGRDIGEVTRLLEKGVIAGGRSKENYQIILNEGDALRKAMESAESGDVIVVFYEDYELIVKTINNYKAQKQNKETEASVG